jgi:hypothetical protein
MFSSSLLFGVSVIGYYVFMLIVVVLTFINLPWGCPLYSITVYLR